MADGWFPVLSPNGRHVASGSTVLFIDNVEIGSGFHPLWGDNDTVYYGRHTDGAFMRFRHDVQEVIAQRGFNFFHAAGDRWVGYRPDTGLTWFDGVVWPGWSEGGLSDTRWAARHQDTGHLYAGLGNGQDGRFIDSRPCLDPCLRGDALTWIAGDRIYGQREHDRSVEDLSLPGEEHFHPIPVLANGQLYILFHTHDRLLLKRWGDDITDGWVVATGTTDTPDARQLEGTNLIRVVWSDRGELRGTSVSLDRPTENLLTPPEPPPPIMNIPGVTIDPNYGKIIKPGQDWRVKVTDRNNPGNEVIVEIVNGSLHVSWKNPAGDDRSGSRRPVTVDCGGPVDPDPGPVDPPPPPPPPVGGPSILVGQVGVESGGGWRDAEDAKNMIGCHLGDLLSLWFHNNPRAREVLSIVRQANYPFHRYWTTLGPGADMWAGREVYPGAPGISPEHYWRGHEDFLQFNRELGLKVIASQGDIRPIVIPDRTNFAHNMADLFDRQGADLCFMFEGANESRDTGEPDPDRLADFVRVFKQRHPDVLCGLSAYTGHEDVNITNAFSREPADVAIVHGYRDGHYWDKIRHIFSFKYESRPNKRQIIQMEPWGFGPDVSAGQNLHEIDTHVAQLGAAISVMTNQAWVYFSDPGIRTDHGPERIEDMPGFWDVPKVASYIPHDVGRYDELFHGGDRFADRRVFAAVGELGRADHAYYRDGRFVCIMYGPEFHRCPQVRNARIDSDITLGDKGRIVYGQVI